MWEEYKWLISVVLVPVLFMVWKSYKSTEGAQWKGIDKANETAESKADMEQVRTLVKHKIKESELKTENKILRERHRNKNVETDQD